MELITPFNRLTTTNRIKIFLTTVYDLNLFRLQKLFTHFKAENLLVNHQINFKTYLEIIINS